VLFVENYFLVSQYLLQDPALGYLNPALGYLNPALGYLNPALGV